ncbi:amino acid ABC transporter substrate-binding protein [Aeromicrobium tamlense]|uniref:Amino acid ABC transporter substrate-binding protein n=1 Tax=Aeromicrobium tamlense TaxID=375541 RepID=A0A8I0FUH5_9ACTN|nr:transporter substrate-binding domain-containing protein [Aeromicrobium tamlense]MBD1270764.1 amino acid ABC transporter substrate-binding protein [Aeromicrobium tamlense]MBD1271104.1 amino acid ABC transporter substrate-binding protein [Aeromicrobium tamlense]NYI38156.1 polar amino acid transport system substrate-binding protein [Aeromicrobium tamlense]
MKKTLSTLLGVALCGITLAACGSSDANGSSVPADCEPIAEVKTLKEGKLTALVAEYPPFIYKDGNDVTGADGELLKRVAASLCLEPDIKQTSFTAIIEGLKSGRADISAGDWTLNAERKSMFQVSDPVYQDLQGVISPDGLDTVDDIMGKKIGTAAGYLVVPDMQKAFGKENVKLYQSDVEGYQDLKAGRIDAYLSGQGALAFLLSQNNDTTMKNVALQPDDRIPATVNPSVAVALVAKDNPDLRDAVNEVIAEYRSSGDLAKVLDESGVDPASADIG